MPISLGLRGAKTLPGDRCRQARPRQTAACRDGHVRRPPRRDHLGDDRGGHAAVDSAVPASTPAVVGALNCAIESRPRPRYIPGMPDKPPIHPGLKFALDLGPLIAFFVANARFGIFAATATVMVAVIAALFISYALTRKWPIMPVITAVLVLVFGTLTLVLQ